MHFVYRLQSLYRGVFNKGVSGGTKSNPGLASALQIFVNEIVVESLIFLCYTKFTHEKLFHESYVYIFGREAVKWGIPPKLPYLKLNNSHFSGEGLE